MFSEVCYEASMHFNRFLCDLEFPSPDLFNHILIQNDLRRRQPTQEADDLVEGISKLVRLQVACT